MVRYLSLPQKQRTRSGPSFLRVSVGGDKDDHCPTIDITVPTACIRSCITPWNLMFTGRDLTVLEKCITS